MRRSIAIAPDVCALSDLGAIVGERGRIDEALGHFATVLQATPNDVQTLVRHGNTLMGLRRYDDALASFDRAQRSGVAARARPARPRIDGGSAIVRIVVQPWPRAA
ncbi:MULTISPECIES: tetratricopeptide repeat protein [Burkholderia]|uniref:tetratricopeptide repeat protein n=1 Tax=Burkholderia TaxID=32008 RepID=UPI00086385F5|nr:MULTISPECIES: tetratricopeptide repeat protein [Burkholderia]AOL07267.1 hypothetical protein WI95_25520 [Burkholderia contaminans]TCW65767.1 hypothetical protein C5O79_26600 [Burkholderia sp. SRS-25]